MNYTTLQNERSDHKSVNTYFADSDGTVWLLFGATLDGILAERCYFKSETLYMGTLATLTYDRFDRWVERCDIVNVDGEASYIVDSVEISAIVQQSQPTALTTLIHKSQSADLIGDIDIKAVHRKYHKLLADPGDCAGDDALLKGMAIADTYVGTGYPGYIPVTQKLACEIADLAD